MSETLHSMKTDLGAFGDLMCEQNELREALRWLIDLMPFEHLALDGLVRNYSKREKARDDMEFKTINAARTVARFLEWDGVPDGLPLP